MTRTAGRLKSLTAGHWFYLYLIEDVFSRKIVGYEVHLVESGEYVSTPRFLTALGMRMFSWTILTCDAELLPVRFRTYCAQRHFNTPLIIPSYVSIHM